MSKYEEVRLVLGQRTLDRANTRKAVLDEGVKEHFTTGEELQLPTPGTVYVSGWSC